MKVMPSQYQMLVEALSGYEKTGISLIAYDGKAFRPAGFGDDIGIYYFIPKIAHALDLSIAESIMIFSVGMAAVSLLIGIAGCLLLFKRRMAKFVGLFELILLTSFSTMVGGTYMAFSSIAVAIVPLFLFLTRDQKWKRTLALFLFFSGAGIAIAHFLRSHSGTGIAIFVAVFLLWNREIRWKQKLSLFLLIGMGIFIPAIYFNTVLEDRDNYLREISPNYERAPRQHIFWHSVYIGLGFLDNEYGMKYRDEVAMEKVRSLSPNTTYLSEEYERILRGEVFKFVKKHPLFIALTLSAKAGVLIFYFLIFANIGLIAIPFCRKRWALEFSFWSAMAFNALFGILVMPDYRYLMGFIAVAVLYGMMSFHQLIEYGDLRNSVRLLLSSGKTSSCVA